MMIVVILVGILATAAVPMYTNLVERTRGQEAKATLLMIRSAERSYHLDNNEYIDLDTLVNDGYLEEPNITGAFFSYDVTTFTQNTFQAQATRQNGPAGTNGTTIILIQNPAGYQWDAANSTWPYPWW